MSCGDVLAIVLVGKFDEFAPFDCWVADDAGVGGASVEVFVDEVVDDYFSEFFA